MSSNQVFNKLGEPVPNNLYKYKSDFNHLGQILDHSKLFVPTPHKLNDPFDVRFRFTKEEVRKLRVEDEKVHEHKFAPDWNKMLDDDAPGGGNEIMQETLFKTMNKIQQDMIAIFSMADSPDNKLLWGYYANGYSGYCLEFDFSHEEQHSQYIFKVDYNFKEDMIEASSFSDLSNPLNYVQPFRIKNEIWDREGEYRLIVANPDEKFDHCFAPIQKQTLKSIYFGYKVEQKLIDEIKYFAVEKGFTFTKYFQYDLTNKGMKLKEV